MDKYLLKSILVDQIHDLISEKGRLVVRTHSLLNSLQDKEITIVTGVRRSGKSSLLRAFIRQLPNSKELIYLNFDDPRLLEFKGQDFERLHELWLESEGRDKQRVAIFDEIQNITGWERWINFFVEQKKFKVFITGSNSKLLSSELATHLTGRHHDIVLFPFSFKEIVQDQEPELLQKAMHSSVVLPSEDRATLRQLFQKYFEYGGFPRVWQSKNLTLLGEYYNDIVYRDIVGRYKLRQPQFIAAFGASVMSDLGRKINKTKLADVIGVREANTINKYFGYFIECYLGQEIRKFDLSIRRQLRNPSKFYAIDPVLAKRVGVYHPSKDAHYLENLVFIELLRRGAKVHYWQEGESQEVDFVVETQNKERHLIQVCWSLDSFPSTVQREVAGFTAFKNAFPNIQVNKCLLITVDEPVGAALSNHNVHAIPFQRWALEN